MVYIQTPSCAFSTPRRSILVRRTSSTSRIMSNNSQGSKIDMERMNTHSMTNEEKVVVEDDIVTTKRKSRREFMKEIVTTSTTLVSLGMLSFGPPPRAIAFDTKDEDGTKRSADYYAQIIQVRSIHTYYAIIHVLFLSNVH